MCSTFSENEGMKNTYTKTDYTSPQNHQGLAKEKKKEISTTLVVAPEETISKNAESEFCARF